MKSKALKNSVDLKRIRLFTKIDRFILFHQELQLDSCQIKTIVDLFKKWRKYYGTRRKAFSRKVLYFLLERMFWSGFDDGCYVADLLSYLHETDDNLDCVFVPDCERCPSLRDVNLYEFREYFLKHAYQQKVLFDGHRLPCTRTDVCPPAFTSHLLGPLHPFPTQMVSAIPDPVPLRQMLRYGAFLSYQRNYASHCSDEIYNHYRQQDLIGSLIVRLVRINPCLLPFYALDLTPEEKKIYAKCVLSCELLLCDFSQGSPAIVYGVNIFTGICWEDFPHYFRKFSQNIVPHINKHFTDPMDLKQSCRLAIRRILNEKWLLPAGIGSLPIPESLKRYIGLVKN